ncbi:Glycosyltransferase Family 69 protein [Tuber magnatum]|uniref:Glycosyltransferase Family 69 protein n=1 Tax=Tuber magnatum TaxID=42249 RepID=A0A317STY2_9PEZI|nr:Glycosyltransferase Family 69 protein [Tuber magnatum]
MPVRRASRPASPILRSSSSSVESESYELSKRTSAPPEEFALGDEEDEDIEASSPSRGLLGDQGKNHTTVASSRRLKWGVYLSFLRLCCRRSGSLRRRCWQVSTVLLSAVGLLLVFTFIFNPSYTKTQYPENYAVVANAVRNGGGVNPQEFWRGKGGTKATKSGRGNPAGEKVFIAANIIDADLINGAWGNAVMELMDLIGGENVFLSIFENDSGPETKAALEDLDKLVAGNIPKAGRSIVSTTLPLAAIPRVKLPNDKTYIKRITYLAEVRNRALLPLAGYIPSLYDKILFLNDVVFDPVQALHLLFSTNQGKYEAACGMDFINPFKYYDTFATRDIDGYNLGVPFYPYFAPGRSRKALQAATDAVPVLSCWGGIVAFQADVFTRNDPVLFRSSKEPYWDASECCLIHADIHAPNATYMNPYIRVTYDLSTFGWLPMVKRIEKLFAGPHWLIGKLVGMPWSGERRKDVENGGYCGSWKLLVMKEGEEGRGWKNLPVPEDRGN